jgi:hypothetical protein
MRFHKAAKPLVGNVEAAGEARTSNDAEPVHAASVWKELVK